MKLGFLGLGQMGRGMAANLIKAGHEVHLYNRSADKAAGLGGIVAATPAEAVQQAEVVFTMLAHDAALREVAFGEQGFIAALPAGAIHVSCSTISVALAEELAVAHEAAG